MLLLLSNSFLIQYSCYRPSNNVASWMNVWLSLLEMRAFKFAFKFFPDFYQIASNSSRERRIFWHVEMWHLISIDAHGHEARIVFCWLDLFLNCAEQILNKVFFLTSLNKPKTLLEIEIGKQGRFEYLRRVTSKGVLGVPVNDGRCWSNVMERWCKPETQIITSPKISDRTLRAMATKPFLFLLRKPTTRFIRTFRK